MLNIQRVARICFSCQLHMIFDFVWRWRMRYPPSQPPKKIENYFYRMLVPWYLLHISRCPTFLSMTWGCFDLGLLYNITTYIYTYIYNSGWIRITHWPENRWNKASPQGSSKQFPSVQCQSEVTTGWGHPVMFVGVQTMKQPPLTIVISWYIMLYLP